MSDDLLARFLVPEEDSEPLGPCVVVVRRCPLMLECAWPDGNRCAIAYVTLASVLLNPSKGLEIDFARHRLKVHGRRLAEVFERLRDHRVGLLRVVDPSSPVEDENIPVIEHIGLEVAR